MNGKNNTRMIITVSAVIFACLLVIAAVINIIKYANVTTKEKRLQARLNQLNAVIERNDAEIAYKSTDEYIEKYVRDYMNMIGKDEIAFTGK